MAPSHYLYQISASHYWGFVTSNWEQIPCQPRTTILYNKFETYSFKITAAPPTAAALNLELWWISNHDRKVYGADVTLACDIHGCHWPWLTHGRCGKSQIARFMRPTWPVGPRWAPCWLHEPCYQIVAIWWDHIFLEENL